MNKAARVTALIVLALSVGIWLSAQSTSLPGIQGWYSVGKVWKPISVDKNGNLNIKVASGSVVEVASGTATMGTSAISSGTCDTVVTVAATGALTTDNLVADFNADPTGTTGYIPSTNGMLTIIKYLTAGNAKFKVCNNTSASVTPGAAVVLQFRVIR